MGTIKSNGPYQRFFCMAWAEDLSAFGQHQKFLLHARKTSGTLGKRKAFLVWTKWVSCAGSGSLSDNKIHFILRTRKVKQSYNKLCMDLN